MAFQVALPAFGRRFGETTAILFPLVLVVLRMAQGFKDKDLLAWVKDAGDQPVLVATDVENDAVSDNACTAEVSFDIAPRTPGNGPMVDMRVPSTQCTISVPAAGQFPKLSKPSLGNDPHIGLLLLSALWPIVVRKIRTVNANKNKWIKSPSCG
jgi:hypothetical protein